MIPSYFECPVSMCLIEKPKLSPTGYSYESTEITKVISQIGRDPMTQREISESQLLHNTALHRAIDVFKGQYPFYDGSSLEATDVFSNDAI